MQLLLFQMRRRAFILKSLSAFPNYTSWSNKMYYSNEKNLIKAEDGFYDFKQSIGLAHLLNPG